MSTEEKKKADADSAIDKAQRIINELSGRSGFEFGDIDDDIMDEILESIALIIQST